MDEKWYFVCHDWIIPSTVDLLKVNTSKRRSPGWKCTIWWWTSVRQLLNIAVLFAGMPFVPRHLSGIASRFNCYSWLILAVKTQFHGLPTAHLLPTCPAAPLGLNEGNRIHNLCFLRRFALCSGFLLMGPGHMTRTAAVSLLYVSARVGWSK